MNKSHPKSLAGRPELNSELLGQVFTPKDIAERMARFLLKDYQDEEKIEVLDPCVGPATFPKELVGKIDSSKLNLTVFDIDCDMIEFTKEWCLSHPIEVKSVCDDYLDVFIDGKYDFAILNPPYVRQEWIDKKRNYQETFKKQYNISVPGTSNLYVYFMVKAIMDLKPGGSFVSIVYDSWQSTLYGQWLAEFIQNKCEMIKIENIDNQPFENRLINATIISGKKRIISPVKETQRLEVKENELLHRSTTPLSKIQGFRPIGEIFQTKRGLRLKQTSFFMCDRERYEEISTPFVKKVNKIKGFRVEENHPEAALLVTEDSISEEIVQELNTRLEMARLNPEKNKSILNWYKERPEAWFLHPVPPKADIIFNYYMRNRPKHILNNETSYSDNFYGIKIDDELLKFAFLAILNSTIVCNDILNNARNQGSGLNKIQLYEYRRVLVPDLTQLSEKEVNAFHVLGRSLVENVNHSQETIKEIDWLIYKVFSDEFLKPSE